MALMIFIFCAFFTSILLLYPSMSFLRGTLMPKPIVPAPNEAPFSIIVSCYNEEKYIFDKITELVQALEQNPASELLLFSTGSTDKTNEILLPFKSHPQISIEFGPRTTKIEALNYLVPQAKHDLLVFSDCRQVMKPNSIQNLLSYFVNDEVGTVSCTIVDTESTPSFFRKLYIKMAQLDMQSGSSLNLYGALYAQRKSVFRPIPQKLLFDDFYVAVSTLAQKKRLLQAPNAILYDIPFQNYYSPERCQRLARGLLLFLGNEYALLARVPIATRIRIFIYKYLKLIIAPIFLLGFIAFMLLFDTQIAQVILILFLIALTSLLLIKKTRTFLLFLFRINYYFLKAIFGYLFLNQRSNNWEKLKILRARVK